MSQVSTSHVGDVASWRTDGVWTRAAAVIDRHVIRHLAKAGLEPTQIDLTIVEEEQIDRPGRPALRVSMGTGDTWCSTFVDWNGVLSWGRPRAWLDRNVLREIARRRWIMAMSDRGLSPDTASFADRAVHPLLHGIVGRRMLTMDMLVARHGPGRSVRYALGGAAARFGRRRSWRPHVETDIPDMPVADVTVDHDRVDVSRMVLSRDVQFHGGDDVEPTVRLGRHRLPDTTLLALSGRPLSDLIDSPILSDDAMPIVERMRTRRNGSQEAVLRRAPNGMPATTRTDVRP